MAKEKLAEELSRRERQVMNILFRRGQATVAEVMEEMPEPPTYSAVRSIQRILAGKQLITHREEGPRYVYVPAVSTDRARDEALRQVVDVLRRIRGAGGHRSAPHLGRGLSEAELARLRERIKSARRRRR
jgi:predicted transcriptional regulator